MRSTAIRFTAAFLALSAIGACTTDEKVPVSVLNVTPTPYDKVDIRTIVAGRPAVMAFGSEDRFRATMEALGESCPDNVRPGKCLADLRKQNGNKGSAKLKNVGGGPGRAVVGSKDGLGGNFQGIADMALNPNGTYRGVPENYRVQGQIMETCEDGSSGYSLTDPDNDGLWTLSLCVTTYTTVERGVSGKEKTTALQMRVLVDDAARIEMKNMADPADVFPNASAATGITLDSITAAGFNYKLYASGSSISIVDVWVDRNYDENDPGFISVARDVPAFEYLYETSVDSCIDMMFASHPPSTLPPGTPPPFYCLGRCKAYPSLINTL